jgi:hypothetical protein
MMTASQQPAGRGGRGGARAQPPHTAPRCVLAAWELGHPNAGPAAAADSRDTQNRPCDTQGRVSRQPL